MFWLSQFSYKHGNNAILTLSFPSEMRERGSFLLCCDGCLALSTSLSGWCYSYLTEFNVLQDNLLDLSVCSS